MMFWRNLLHRDRIDEDWREEMKTHLEMLTNSFIEQGLEPEEARSAALKQAGNLTAWKEEIYRMNGIQWLESIAGDVRYAVRGLRKNLFFTAVAVLTLALGIGANTAVFSVVNSILLRPLPFPRAEELMEVAQLAPGAGGIISSRGLALSASMYFTYSEQNRSFQSMGVWTSRNTTVTGMAEPEQVTANLVSDGLLQTLAKEPEIGRPLLPGDQLRGSDEVVLLTHGYWQRRFGGARAVIGRKILVDARPREIVGVMPAGFRIADAPADLILPLQLDRSRSILAGFYLGAIARLRPGVSLAQANADIARLIPIWMRSWPSIGTGNAGDAIAEKVYLSWRIAPNIRSLRDSVVGNVTSVLWVVMGTLGMVMLIACANIANLLLVRADARHTEFAIRAALGAGRGRIVRQLLIESLLLSTLGGMLGLGVAVVGLRFLVRNGPSHLPRLGEVGLDVNALAFTAAIAVLSALGFGLIPALRLSGSRGTLGLRDAGRIISPSKNRQRARGTLVMVQVALALVLLISSGLMIRTFQSIRNVDMGFKWPGTLQVFRVAIPRELVPDEEQAARGEQAIASDVAALPGVTAVGFSSALPMDGSPPNWDGILLEGQSYAKDRPPMRLYVNVSPGFFGALGSKIKAGHDFRWADVYRNRKLILVSENLARELWGSANAAIGKRIRTTEIGPWREIAGVVEDVRHSGPQQPAPAAVYWPIYGVIPYAPEIAASRSVVYSVRTSRAGTGPLLNEIRQAVSAVNPALAVANPETMREILDRSTARTSFTLVMLAIAGAMALTLGLIGIYGVITYAVAQRTREIGIRIALGAEPADVRRVFVRHGLRLCVFGIAIGLGAAAMLTRTMRSLLFGVTPVDPLTFAAVPLALFFSALVACYLPARRASRVDPIDCMRAE